MALTIKNLPYEVYVEIFHCLDKRDLCAWAGTSRRNYTYVCRAATEARLIGCRKTFPPSIPLTCFERMFASLPLGEMFLGEKDDLELLKKRVRDLSFASSPQNHQFITTLDRFFPERAEYAAGIEAERAGLAPEYRAWITSIVQTAPDGLEPWVFRDNIRNLIRRYQENPTASALKVLRDAQAIFPHSELSQLIDLVEANPQTPNIVSSPVYEAFHAKVDATLGLQYVPQIMKGVESVFVKGLSCFEKKQTSLNFMILLAEISTMVSGPGFQVFKKISAQTLSEKLGLTLEEALELQSLPTDADLAPFIHLPVPEDFDMSEYLMQFKRAVSILQKAAEGRTVALNKQDHLYTILWRALFLEDKESVSFLVHSPAFFFFQWKDILNNPFRFWQNRSDLFFHLISHPRVLDSLFPKDFKKISTAFASGFWFDFRFARKNPSSLLPFLNYPDILRVWGSSDTSHSVTFLFPFLLGRHEISPLQWTHLFCLFLGRRWNPEDSGIVLNTLVQEKRSDLIEVFFRMPDLQGHIPSQSSSDRLISFFSVYPLLWDRLQWYPEEAARLLEPMVRDIRFEWLYEVIGRESCVEAAEFFLTHPDLVENIAKLDVPAVSLAFENVCGHYSLKDLVGQQEIRQALQLSFPFTCLSRGDLESTLDLSVGILFAHNRYLLKLIFRVKSDPSRFLGLEDIFQFVQTNAPLLQAMSKPPVDGAADKKPPHRVMSLLSAKSCFGTGALASPIGWDTIFQRADPSIAELLVRLGAPRPASAPRIELLLPEEEAPQMPAPLQKGGGRKVAEQISRFVQARPSMLENVWNNLKECTLLRRIVLIFRLPQFLSKERYQEFYRDLPLFYRAVGKIGKIWANTIRKWS